MFLVARRRELQCPPLFLFLYESIGDSAQIKMYCGHWVGEINDAFVKKAYSKNNKPIKRELIHNDYDN